MLAKVLKENQNFIPVMIFILWAIGFYFLNLMGVTAFEPLLTASLATVGMLIVAVIFNNLSFFKNNYYFAFLWSIGYLLLSCCLNNLAFFSALLFLFVVLTQLVFAQDNADGAWFNAFDLGFYTAIAIVLHPPFWIFGLLFLVHFIFLGKGQIYNLIFYLLGVIALGLIGIEVIAILDAWEFLDNFLMQFTFSMYSFQTNDLFLVPIFVLAAISAIDYVRNLNRQGVNKKAVFFDGMLWFGCALLYNALYGLNDGNSLLLLIIPIVLYIANYLTHAKILWRKEVTLWAFLIFLVLYRFQHLIVIPEFFKTITF